MAALPVCRSESVFRQTDFSSRAGTDDVIDISAFGFASFGAVPAAATDAGSNVIIQLDADDFNI